MMFSIDHVSETAIGGWLAPDNPSAIVAVIVVDERGERHHVPATIVRPDVRQAGLHGSGLCGFILNETSHPWFRPTGALEIYDNYSNVLLYRRTPANASAVRLAMVVPPSGPLIDLGKYVSPAVRMIYSNAEMIPEETLFNILLFDTDSIVVSGSMNVSKFEAAIRMRNWQAAICLPHPARELAARLLRLQDLAAHPSGSWRRLGEGELVEAFGNVDLTDPAALGKAVRRLNDEQYHRLANPIVGLLAAKRRGEPVRPQYFGRALSQLAEFAAVGIDSELDAFLDGIDHLLGRSDLPRPAPPADAKADAVFAVLAECPPARELFDMDLALFEEARGAMEGAKAAAPSTAPEEAPAAVPGPGG